MASDPAKARAQATAVLRSAPDPAAGAVAERVLGLAAKEQGEPAMAAAHLYRSLRLATEADTPELQGLARMSLAGVAVWSGRLEEALGQTELALAELRGVDRARCRAQKAVLLQRLGEGEEALEEYRRALATLRRLGARDAEASVLGNRGILYAYRGDLAAATTDLRRALALHEEAGAAVAATETRHNLGFVAARHGDVPAALRWFDQADVGFRALGLPRASALLDRCEAFLSVRLVAEARALATDAVTEFTAAGMATDLAEAELLLAQAMLLDGALDEAGATAAAARRRLVAQGRRGWAVVAEYVLLVVSWEGDRHSAALGRKAKALAPRLEAYGWQSQALHTWLIAGRVALARGQRDEASFALNVVAGARRVGTSEARARGWHAAALLALSRGDHPAARRALAAGLRALVAGDAVLGATELRVHAAGRGEELVSLGLRLAVDRGRPREVLAWAEAYRGRVLRRPPAGPPDEAALAEALAQLRQVAAELEQAAAAGSPTASLRRRRGLLEGEVRRMTRTATAADVGARTPALVGATLARRLGHDVLLQLVELDGVLRAVTLADGRTRLWVLGSVADATAEVDALRFALARLARNRGSPASVHAAAAAADHAAARLDALLFGSLGSLAAGRPVMVVPTGRLHAVPWAALPSRRGVATAVLPSLALCLRRPKARSGQARVLVAGPGPAGAPAEIEELAELHPGATTLVGSDSLVEVVRRSIDGAAMAHLAAHGTFRADNPQFSSLHLADGALTVYDLERLTCAPDLLILSACESGLTDVRGEELMGLAGALFSLGCRTLVASVVPVPDATTRQLMVELHRRLIAGSRPAEALAGAQVAVAESLDAGPASTAGFVCFGSGS